MKRLITIFTAVSLILITSPAIAVVYTTDFGSWEPAAYIYINWGQLEPVTSGGGYGGFGSGGDNFPNYSDFGPYMQDGLGRDRFG